MDVAEQEWTVRFDNMIYAGEIFVTLIPDKENRDRVVAMHNDAVDEIIADDAEIIVELEAQLKRLAEALRKISAGLSDQDDLMAMMHGSEVKEARATLAEYEKTQLQYAT